jgi:hypothetical protein
MGSGSIRAMMTDTQTTPVQVSEDLQDQSPVQAEAVDQKTPDATAVAAERAGLLEQEEVELAEPEPAVVDVVETVPVASDETDAEAVTVEPATEETTADPVAITTDELVAATSDEPVVGNIDEVVETEAATEQAAAEAEAQTDPSQVEPEFDAASPEALLAPVADETPATEEATESTTIVDDVASRLARLEERVATLTEDLKSAANRATFLGRVQRMMKQIPEEASEQATALRTRLGEIERDIMAQIEERRTLKEAIVEKAEALANSNEWKATGDAMRGLFEQWKAIGSAGHEAEDALWKRFQAARDAFSARRNEWFEGRQKEWAGNREKKEALSVRAEELSESTDWRATADAMRNLMAEWKTIGSAGRESDDALWSRFRAAQQIFFDRRSTTYDENMARKEELCAKAEAESASTDWRATAETMKALQAAWKEVGPVGSRDLEDKLWNRFRGATQAFFDRRGSTFADRDREEGDNLRRKEELCVEAEALAVAADPVAATEEAKALQAEWKTIGPVRRDRGDQLWARFRSACDRVFENSVNERARRQVQWSMKMREALERKEEQLARLEEAILHDEATVQRWQASIAVRPDPSTSAKIADTTNRLAEKRTRAADLKSSIEDIRLKMKD